MLKIKLQRIGKKHQPSYRVVVAEKRSKLESPPVEDLGFYNPLTKAATFNGNRVSYWLGHGAKPTVTTHNLLVKNGILATSKVRLRFKTKASPKTEIKPTEVLAKETSGETAPS